MIEVVAHVSVATLFGSMAFFTCVVAPLTFITLDAVTAGRFVRALFPWYYLVIVGLALTAAGGLAGASLGDGITLGLVALSAWAARQQLMPRINHYRDRMTGGDATAERPFTRLHRWSVWLNGAQLLAVFVVLLRSSLR